MGPIQSDTVGESIANAVKQSKDEVIIVKTIIISALRTEFTFSKLPSRSTEYYTIPMCNLSRARRLPSFPFTSWMAAGSSSTLFRWPFIRFVAHYKHFNRTYPNIWIDCTSCFPVNPKIAAWLPGLFCLNERALYMGKWKHGFFSFTAVGKCDIGAIIELIQRSISPKSLSTQNVSESLI